MSQHNRYHCFFLILLAAVLFIPPAPAFAGDEPPIPPFAAGPMGAPEGTRVQLISEAFTLEVPRYSAQKYGEARVSAAFHFFNHGTQAEKINLRFPVGPVVYDGSTCFSSTYPTISNLTVWVNNFIVPSRAVNADVAGPTGQVSIPCWMEYPLSFPAGRDVIVTSSYSVLGYSPDPSSGTVEYNLILSNEAGWYGEVESAEVYFRLPYPVTRQNLLSCQVGDSPCQQNEEELRWRQERFEPQVNFSIDLTNPAIWWAILNGKDRAAAYPRDSRVWGLLGQAYKQAAWTRRGFRTDPGGKEMIDLSVQAYRQAISLQARDADQRFGLAELLCWQSESTLAAGDTPPNWSACLQELKGVIDLNPRHSQALALLAHLNEISPGLVGLSTPPPVFLALTITPTPTLTTTPSVTPSGTALLQPSPSPSAILAPSPTASPTASAVPPLAESPSPVTPTAPAPPAPLGANLPPGLFTILGLLLILGAYAVSRMRIKK
ncbi:MAG TPA: hypothetical protein VMT46_14615 [Anaerolineaceae bacterium]|nr:hypothetical protein [Anaerolineaceae bacterium]